MAFNSDEYIGVIVEQIAKNFKTLDVAVKACTNLKKAKDEYEKSLDKKEEDFFVQSIDDLICDKYRTIEPLSVGLFGEWGSGKTHLLKMIKSCINEKEDDFFPQITIPVFFNAWRFEKEEHLIIPLFQTMLAELESYEHMATDEKVKKFIRHSGRKLKILSISLLKGLKVPTDIKHIINSLAEGDFSALATDVVDIDKVKESYKDGNKEEFEHEELLSDLLKSDRLESIYLQIPQWIEKIAVFDNINFVFLIDDLDRCLPENTLKMLESIKLFLDVPSCSFVLAIDDDVVERGVAYHYREYLQNGNSLELPITGHEYLEKMIQLPFRIPVIDSHNVRTFLKDNYKALFDDIEKVTPISDELLNFFAKTIPPKPRKIKRVAMLFETKIKIFEKLKLPIDYRLIAKITLLELFAPKLLRFIQNNGYRRIFDRLVDFRNIDKNEKFESKSLGDIKLIKEWIKNNGEQKEQDLNSRVLKIIEDNYASRMVFELDNIFDIKIEADVLKVNIELQAPQTITNEQKEHIDITSSVFMEKLFRSDDSTSWRDAFEDDEEFADANAILSDEQLDEVIKKAKEDTEFGSNPQWVGVVAEYVSNEQYIKMLKELYSLRFSDINGKFEMGTYQVTFAEYDRYCEVKNIKKLKDEGWGRGKRPVIHISWEDASQYATWLSQKLNHTYRLPTENEWYKACNGDKKSAWYFGNDVSELSEYGWYRKNSDGKTHPVGEKKPNDFGLYDMHGNVREWCEDWYDEDKNRKVLRGGSWNLTANRIRSSSRDRLNPTYRYSRVGFRLLRTLPS